MANILVLGEDKDETNARALLIEFAGYQCIPAESFQEAVNVLKDSRVDLAIVDGSLFGTSTVEVLSALKTASSATPVMLLSDKSGKVFGGDGADEVLALPCSYERFFRSIESVLGRFARASD